MEKGFTKHNSKGFIEHQLTQADTEEKNTAGQEITSFPYKMEWIIYLNQVMM